MADKWIAGATKNKGGLHRSVGVAQGKKIPYALVAKAASGKLGPKAAKQGRLAMTLRGMRKGDSDKDGD